MNGLFLLRDINYFLKERFNMRTLFLIKGLILSGLFLSGCIFGGGNLDPGLIVAASEREDQSDSRIERRRRENSGAECGEDRSCEDVCVEVYNEDNEDENEGKVETCLEVRYHYAIQFEDILEILEEPYESSLRNIEEDAFFEFLDVSLQPWIETTGSTSSSESEALLIWIARESDISQAIYDAYRNYEQDFNLYEGVQNLFEDIGSGKDNDGKVNDCDRNIVGDSKSYKDIAEENNNCEAAVIYNEVCSDTLTIANCP